MRRFPTLNQFRAAADTESPLEFSGIAGKAQAIGLDLPVARSRANLKRSG